MSSSSTTSPDVDPWAGYPSISCYAPPCIELAWEVGPSSDDPNPKEVLRQICLLYKGAVAAGYPEYSFEEWLDGKLGDNLKRFQAWNHRTGGRLTDEEVEEVAFAVGDSHRTKFTCVGARGCLSLKQSCDPDDCKLCKTAEGGAVEYPPEIIERAKDIIELGDPVAFLMEQYHRNHRGDDTLGLGWFCSFASGQSLTSNGIQPAAHSENPGQGKTDSGKAAFHCIDTRRDLETSVSAMSLYRDDSLRAGDIIFSDDIEWSTALTSTVKRAMSNFQTTTYHTTLDKKGKLLKVAIPPRLLWWFTSIESSANDQIVDRQFLFDVDVSEEHHKGVNEDILNRRSTKTLKFEVDDDILTARCITTLIKKGGPFRVEIPFAKFIEWKLPAAHRDLNRFLDLIDALAILRYPQRSPQKGEDGATWLTASIDDYRDAKKVFASRQKNIRSHLTDAETKILVTMAERIEWTQAELTERMGVNQSNVSRRLAALLEKTSYIKSWNVRGEKLYAVTDKTDLSIFSNQIVALSLPTSRTFTQTNNGRLYAPLCGTYAHLMRTLCAININNSKYNSVDLCAYLRNQISEIPSNTKLDNHVTEDLSERENIEKRINPENQQQATESSTHKSRISLHKGRISERISPPIYHVLEDVGTIAGTDGKTRTLKRGDLISDIPVDQAGVLINRGALREVIS